MGNSAYCTLYIVRHGQTEWNIKELLQGQKDSPLTEKGIAQAQALSKEFRNLHFDAVFASDLTRAKRTAEIITLEKKLAVKTSQLLRERNYGIYEGKRNDIFKTELKHLLEKYERLSDEQKKKHKYPTTESDEEIVSRFITFIREVSVAYLNKTILIVTHGGIMRALLIHLGFGTYKNLRGHTIANCAYVKLLSDGVELLIKETKGITKLDQTS